MSTDKPFPLQPGYEYWQLKDRSGKMPEAYWSETLGWHTYSYFGHDDEVWARRKLPCATSVRAFEEKPKPEWVRFADREPPSLYYPLWVWSAEVSYHGNQPIICVDAAHAKIAFATHWMKAELPAPPPPGPTQEEKDECEAVAWGKSHVGPLPSCMMYAWNWVDAKMAFLAGIQHGRKSK